MMTTIFLAHVAATWFMVGLIWFVQVVHYPLFNRVGDAGYATYQHQHMRRTSWVVGPPMLLEAATAAFFLWRPPDFVSLPWVITGAVLVLAIWCSTAMLQVPQHSRLTHGFERIAHRRLVLGNWIRTALWSVRGIWVLLPLIPSG